MSWKKYFSPVNSVLPSQQGSTSYGASVSKFNTWLPEVYQGPPNRLQRYMHYEQMDYDHEVSASLDTIAEFCTQLDPRNQTPFQFHFKDDPTASEMQVLEKSLQQWNTINDFNRRIFRIFRSTLMYGDQFFVRDPQTYKLVWIDPSTVEKIIVNESKGKEVEIYFIKDLDLNLQTLTGTNTLAKSEMGYNSAGSLSPNVPFTGQTNYVTTGTPNLYSQGTYFGSGSTAFPVDATHVVHVSLTEGLDNTWPFGISVLEYIFKVYKQKQLLEDSILIYRVHRAPERRVFFIDIGQMPPAKAQQYIERVKYEVQQKRIPNKTGGGQNITDAAYNPMSMLEDYYFAVTPEGRGSKVEVLPGGENLGQIDDLRYFNNKMMRALGVPSAYLPTGPEDGTNTYNDGRVGTAFIQEFRFNKRCVRLQNQIIKNFDKEFKLFLKHRGITVDNGLFELKFTSPQNFSAYRQIELDNQRANLFGTLAEIPYLSKRFVLKKYLGLSTEEMKENEKLWKEENAELSLNNMEGGNVDLRHVGITGGLGGSIPSGLDAGMPEGEPEGDEALDATETGQETQGPNVSQQEIDSFGK